MSGSIQDDVLEPGENELGTATDNAAEDTEKADSAEDVLNQELEDAGGIFDELSALSKLDLDDGAGTDYGVHAAAKAPSPRSIRAEVYDWLSCLVSAILVCVIMFVFAARIIGVIGSSMSPTLSERDMVVISNLFYSPRQGDIVVFRKESFKTEPLVKRIIATSGSTVDIDFDTGEIVVDGVLLEEDYIAELTRTRLDYSEPVTVPEGFVFVMGDNRNHSLDSRSSQIGLVDEREIMGKVYLVLLPITNFGSVY